MTAPLPLNSYGVGNTEAACSDSVKRLLGVIELVGRPIMICSRIRFNHQEIEALLSQPLVVSIVLEVEDPELVTAFPGRLGFFIGSGSDWQLPLKSTNEIVYIGRWDDLGVRVAWLAWRAGVSRIHIRLRPW